MRGVVKGIGRRAGREMKVGVISSPPLAEIVVVRSVQAVLLSLRTAENERHLYWQYRRYGL
jgi:hypothetical protein